MIDTVADTLGGSMIGVIRTGGPCKPPKFDECSEESARRGAFEEDVDLGRALESKGAAVRFKMILFELAIACDRALRHMALQPNALRAIAPTANPVSARCCMTAV